MVVAAVVCQRHFSPLARSSCSPTNALTPCPDPPRPISAIPDRSRPSAVPRNGAATEQNGKKRPDGAESAAVGGSRKAPAAEAIRGQVCARVASPGALRRPSYRPSSPATARARQIRGGGAGGGAATGLELPPARGARQDAQEGAVAWGWGAHALVCRPASAGCAPPTLSASGLPLSDAAHTAGRSD